MKFLGFNITREAKVAPAIVREAPATPAKTTTTEGKQDRGGNFASNAVPIYGQHSALAVSAWYCGLAMKANTFGQLILEYQRQNKTNHGWNYQIHDAREGKRMNFLTQVRPNPLMNAKHFWTQAAIQREVYGNAVIYIERDNYGDIAALWLCTSASLNIATMDYTITYNKPYLGPTSLVVPSENIIHWRNTYSNDGGLTGISTLTYARQALSLAATNDAQALETSAKGGKYKILIKEEADSNFGLNVLNKDQREGARQSLQEQMDMGLDVVEVNSMMDPKIISQTAQEMALIENRKWDVPTIARFLNMPLVLLMDYTNNTYKAPEQAMLAFLQNTIAPMKSDVEMEFNSKLIGVEAFPTLRFHFNDKNLMSLDPKGRMEIAKMQLECGIKCVDELRAEFDLPALEKDGDIHLVSTNLQRLDDIKVGSGGTIKTDDDKKKPKDKEE